MRILLIYPPFHRTFGEESPYAPLGLCYIAAVLEKHGHSVSIYQSDLSGLNGPKDPPRTGKFGYAEHQNILNNITHPLWTEIESVIRAQSPDIVGISVRTAFFQSALNVSRIVKKVSSAIPVVWGGVHPTILPEETLQNKEINFVVRGEGEYTFLELVENLSKPEGIRGLSYKKEGEIISNPGRPLIRDINELPFPAKHLILGINRFPRVALSNIFATRGCPYNCIFCASHELWTRKVRYRSARNIVDEMKLLKEVYKVNRFSFEDDALTVSEKFVRELCELMLQEKLDVKWRCETRVDLVSDGIVKLMKKAGCQDVFLGIESGNEETLQKIKKGITKKQVENACEILKRQKVRYSTLWIIGFPWETKQHIQDTVAFMRQLDPPEAFFHVAQPFPGTELFEICRQGGLLPEQIDWSTFFSFRSSDMYPTKRVSPPDITKLIDDTLRQVDRRNRTKMLQLLLTNPLYAFRRLRENGLLSFGYLWATVRSLHQ